LLSEMGVEFDVHITDTDESMREGEAAQDYVSRLARDKASAAAAQLPENVAILAADTIVVKNDRVLGKPRDFVRLVITDVEFGNISSEQMQRYWQTGEPQDKAGAYAIQGFASAWVKLINGSYSSVVGLPLREVNELLTSIDHHWL